jgi:hypothetical protein
VIDFALSHSHGVPPRCQRVSWSARLRQAFVRSPRTGFAALDPASALQVKHAIAGERSRHCPPVAYIGMWA